MRMAGAFSLDELNLEHRLKVPVSGNYTDSGSRGGIWTLGSNTRVDSPDNHNLGFGLDLANAVYRDSPTWMTGTQDCTIMWWAKVAPGIDITNHFCTAADTGIGYSGHEVDVIDDGTVNFAAGGNGTEGIASSVNRKTRKVDPTSDLRDSTWRHVAYTFSGVSAQKLYNDGVGAAFVDFDGSATTLGWGVSGIRWQVNVEDWSNDMTVSDWGEIADVRLYSEQLSDARIDLIAKGRA